MFRTGQFLGAIALSALILSPAIAVEKSKDANPSSSTATPAVTSGGNSDKTPSKKPTTTQTPTATRSVDDILDEADQYYDGDGVKQDYDKALALYREAAAMGDGYGYDMVGLMYDLGRSVKEDPKEA